LAHHLQVSVYKFKGGRIDAINVAISRGDRAKLLLLDLVGGFPAVKKVMGVGQRVLVDAETIGSVCSIRTIRFIRFFGTKPQREVDFWVIARKCGGFVLFGRVVVFESLLDGRVGRDHFINGSTQVLRMKKCCKRKR
jgi:hypothetical protein